MGRSRKNTLHVKRVTEHVPGLVGGALLLVDVMCHLHQGHYLHVPYRNHGGKVLKRERVRCWLVVDRDEKILNFRTEAFGCQAVGEVICRHFNYTERFWFGVGWDAAGEWQRINNEVTHVHLTYIKRKSITRPLVSKPVHVRLPAKFDVLITEPTYFRRKLSLLLS